MSELDQPRQLTSLIDILPNHSLLLCDLWGVVHDGLTLNPHVHSVFKACREAGLTIVLLSNAPRPSRGVVQKLDAMGLERPTYDHIVTSGDVALTFAAKTYPHQKAFLLGDEVDRSALGLDLGFEWVDSLEEADFVFAMGFGRGQVLADFEDVFNEMLGRKLPMVCANADKWVPVGPSILPCAGLMAERYQQLGGETSVFGKPHKAVYEKAYSLAEQQVDCSRALVIGDNMDTDIVGGFSIGATTVLVTSGVHRKEFDGLGHKKGPIDIFKSIRPDYLIEKLT